MEFVLSTERTKESFPGNESRRVLGTPRATAIVSG